MSAFAGTSPPRLDDGVHEKLIALKDQVHEFLKGLSPASEVSSALRQCDRRAEPEASSNKWASSAVSSTRQISARGSSRPFSPFAIGSAAELAVIDRVG